MRILSTRLFLCQLSLLTLVLAFPESMSDHNGHSGHQGMHKSCPYANAKDQAELKTEHEKRFLFSLMKSPIDSMPPKPSRLSQFVTKQ